MAEFLGIANLYRMQVYWSIGDFVSILFVMVLRMEAFLKNFKGSTLLLIPLEYKFSKLVAQKCPAQLFSLIQTLNKEICVKPCNLTAHFI